MPVDDLVLFEKLGLLSKLNSGDFLMLSISLVLIAIFYFYGKEKNNE